MAFRPKRSMEERLLAAKQIFVRYLDRLKLPHGRIEVELIKFHLTLKVYRELSDFISVFGCQCTRRVATPEEKALVGEKGKRACYFINVEITAAACLSLQQRRQEVDPVCFAQPPQDLADLCQPRIIRSPSNTNAKRHHDGSLVHDSPVAQLDDPLPYAAAAAAPAAGSVATAAAAHGDAIHPNKQQRLTPPGVDGGGGGGGGASNMSSPQLSTPLPYRHFAMYGQPGSDPRHLGLGAGSPLVDAPAAPAAAAASGSGYSSAAAASAAAPAMAMSNPGPGAGYVLPARYPLVGHPQQQPAMHGGLSYAPHSSAEPSPQLPPHQGADVLAGDQPLAAPPSHSVPAVTPAAHLNLDASSQPQVPDVLVHRGKICVAGEWFPLAQYIAAMGRTQASARAVVSLNASMLAERIHSCR